jgi:hypothetical protein
MGSHQLDENVFDFTRVGPCEYHPPLTVLLESLHHRRFEAHYHRHRVWEHQLAVILLLSLVK